MEIIKAILLVLLSLTLLVTIHELGHFWAAKFFKIRVDIFSIFFPPKLFSIKRGGTSYQIGAIPLGGYVKISGMIDESMDKEFLNKPPEPWEFRAKPVWQRFIVMIGGIVMNILLGIVIFSSLKYMYGDTFTPISETERLTIQAMPGSLGHRIGFRSGDKFLSISGERPAYLERVVGTDRLLSDDVYYEVERNGQKIKLEVPNHLIDSVREFKRAKRQGTVFDLGLPPVIKVIPKDKENEVLPVYSTPLKTGDSIVSVAGQPVMHFQDISYILDAHKTENIEIRYYTAGVDSELAVTIKPYCKIEKKDTFCYIGLAPLYDYRQDTVKYGFGQALVAGFKQAFGVIFLQLRSYNKMAKGDVSFTKNVQGPIGIFMQLVEGFNEYGWPFFWRFTGLISMVLALANLLPIPALDGGHIVFLLYEGVTGRVPSEKVRITAQYVGMVILLSLMVFIFYNDIRRLIFGG